MRSLHEEYRPPSYGCDVPPAQQVLGGSVMGSGMKKDGNKEAYRGNFRRMLHEGGAEGGAGVKEGLRKGRDLIYQSLGLSSSGLLSPFVTL